jgi:hypothetical protein
MITGTHVLIYSVCPEADRAFLRDVLQFRSLDIGHGWLLFKLPPAEAAVHPSDGKFVQEHSGQQMLGAVVYLMCDDVRAVVNMLAEKNVTCGPLEEQDWGIRTTIPMPSGSALGLYQPKHPTALAL